MRKLVLLSIAVIAFVAGCGGSDLKQKVIGTWKIDVNSVKMPALPAGAESNPQVKQMIDQMKQKMAEVRFEFKADGTAVPTGMGSQETAKWSISGNEIKLVDKNGKEDSNMKATLNAEGTKIHLQPLGEQAKQMPDGFDLIKA